MVQLAILVAIMLIFAYTPLGYLKVGAIEITFMVLPVAIGTIILGPVCGAILGGLFGLTSFIQCFGASPFGALLLSLNPIATFITCMVPRILCGWLSGLIFEALNKKENMKNASYFIASLATALLNTIFFMLCIVIFFWYNWNFLIHDEQLGIADRRLMGIFRGICRRKRFGGSYRKLSRGGNRFQNRIESHSRLE